jgi:hypothetical protein
VKTIRSSMHPPVLSIERARSVGVLDGMVHQSIDLHLALVQTLRILLHEGIHEWGACINESSKTAVCGGTANAPTQRPTSHGIARPD